MRAAGAYSGAYVVNVTSGRRVFRWQARHPRILASNTKLFTTAAALARFGTEGTPRHRGARRGSLDEDGVCRGDLYLRGGGDPTFGSRRFTGAPTAAAPPWRTWPRRSSRPGSSA